MEIMKWFFMRSPPRVKMDTRRYRSAGEYNKSSESHWDAAKRSECPNLNSSKLRLGISIIPQNPGQTQKPNSNCIMNAVRGGTGLARPFGNVGPTGTIGHDGIHVVAPAGSRVTTLSPLTG